MNLVKALDAAFSPLDITQVPVSRMSQDLKVSLLVAGLRVLSLNLNQRQNVFLFSTKKNQYISQMKLLYSILDNANTLCTLLLL